MHTNTELALLNNKNWLLPSPDREFQKSVEETSPFRPQRKKKKPTKPVNSSFVSIFPLFKLFFGFDFSCKSVVITSQKRIILIRFYVLLIWFQSCCTQIVPTLFLCAIFQNQRCHFFHKCICNTSAFVIKNFLLLFSCPFYSF